MVAGSEGDRFGFGFSGLRSRELCMWSPEKAADVRVRNSGSGTGGGNLKSIGIKFI